MTGSVEGPAPTGDTGSPVPVGRPRRGRPRDPKVDVAILTAAVDLLADGGYARLTMDQVAVQAGVSKASLYLRWPNKVALVAEAIQHRSGVVPDIPDTESLRGDMLTFLRALLRSYAVAPQAVSAVTGEVASHPELRKAWRKSVAGTLTARVHVIVERAVERGELAAASDVELLSMLPVTLLQNWRLAHDPGPDDALVRRIVDQFYTPPTSREPVDETGRSDAGPGMRTRSSTAAAQRSHGHR